MAASILIVSSLARELFNNEVERLSHIVDEQRARFRTRRRLRRHDLTRLTSICPRCFLNEHTPQVSNRSMTAYPFYPGTAAHRPTVTQLLGKMLREGKRK